MPFDTALLFGYRLLALAIALIMVLMLFRARAWKDQLFAMMVFVPFVLRALGIK
jgi:hypothetical protein